MSEKKSISALTVLLVIAVIAVAAAVAIPAWRSHQAADHVSDALKSTEAAKLVVMEAATTHGGLAHIQQSDVGYNAGAMASPYASSVTIADGGRITLATRNTGATPDPVLLLTPSDNGRATISWACSVLTGDQRMLSDVCQPGNSPSPAAAPAASANTKPAATSTTPSPR